MPVTERRACASSNVVFSRVLVWSRQESAAFELHSMMLEAVDEVVHSDVLLDEFGIPPELWPSVRRSWRSRHTDFLGRLDLLWDGEGEPKLAEYNADTPTVLVESAAAQRQWCRAVHPDKGQFNVLDEALEAGWRAIAEQLLTRNEHAFAAAVSGGGGVGQRRPPLQLTIAAQGVRDRTPIHWDGVNALEGGSSTFEGPAPSYRHWCGLGFEEEEATAVYMASRAARAAATLRQEGGGGRVPLHVTMRCVDNLLPEDLCEPKAQQTGEPVQQAQQALWKLYPWEWLVRETLGSGYTAGGGTGSAGSSQPSFGLFASSASMPSAEPEPLTQMYEPPWKLIMSSKAMLAYLWAKCVFARRGLAGPVYRGLAGLRAMAWQPPSGGPPNDACAQLFEQPVLASPNASCARVCTRACVCPPPPTPWHHPLAGTRITRTSCRRAWPTTRPSSPRSTRAAPSAPRTLWPSPCWGVRAMGSSMATSRVARMSRPRQKSPNLRGSSPSRPRRCSGWSSLRRSSRACKT